jgi:hypothetical protein
VTPAGAGAAAYVAAILVQYVDLPDTPLEPSLTDQALARKLHSEAVPLTLVESALLLATLRRMTRSSELPPLPKIRSLAYFMPVIAELQLQPLPNGYADYLRLKLQKVAQGDRLRVQKSTFLDDR